MVVKTAPATIEDLYNEPGKAELVGGRIVREMSTGGLPGRIAFRIAIKLNEYIEQMGIGEVFGDNVGFTVTKLDSGRESFSPDAAYIADSRAVTMRFIKGAPTFAIEVRSENEYSNSNSEEHRAAKRVDYFAAGTQVVWDVDPLGKCVHVFRAESPAAPVTFLPGQQADAEPAVPGWRIDTEWLFR